MELPTHPLLALVDSNANRLKSMLTHYIDATVDSHYNLMKQNIVEMIQSGQIGSQNITRKTAKREPAKASFYREILDPFELPEEFAFRKAGEKLIYLSLGSMGSIDVELMKRIVSILAKTPHKFIVSKGPLHHEYELPDNCWSKPFLPQTRILPFVDLVITHGGNNTVTEAFACGKPMIVLPLFGDQYDNAQRLQEKGFGIRLETYTFTDEQLIQALDGLLSDKLLYERLEKAKKRIESSNSKELLCHKIEQVVQSFQNKQLNFCGA